MSSTSTDEYVQMTTTYHKKGRQITALPSESIQDSLSCDPGLGATHVVTEVKYGFNAYLSFIYQKKESESKLEIGGSLSVAVNLLSMGIPLEAEGSASLDLDTKSKDIASSLTFEFSGDAIINPPPQSFDDAVEVYKQLPQLAEDNERVVSFSVAPLSEYCGQDGKYVHLYYLHT